MRIEELERNLYIKSTDTVEKYLLNVIQEYFRDSNEALEGTREYIIREAVNRLKTELDYNSLGVLSITLPDGRVLTGDVSIGLDDLGGEPLIDPKLSAFNVDFYDPNNPMPNTAVKSNDPRLYDARKPLQHIHSMDDIPGLSGIVSSIRSLAQNASTSDHSHTNMSTLNMLTYTGNLKVIDLSLLDTLGKRIDDYFDNIRQSITNNMTRIETRIDELNIRLDAINTEIDNIKTYVIEKNEEYLRAAKQYTDDEFSRIKQELITYMDTNFVRRQEVRELISLASKCYTYVNTEEWLIKDLRTRNVDPDTEIASLDLSQATIDELNARQINSTDTKIIFDYYLKYKENGVVKKQKLPIACIRGTDFKSFVYPLTTELTMYGYVQTVLNNKSPIQIAFKVDENNFIKNTYRNDSIVCDIYAKSSCDVKFPDLANI